MTKSLTGDTRLSEALDAHEAVLEYIISLNPHDFNRLRTPLLRKVMPPRITLRRIAAIAGIPERQLLRKVNELAGRPYNDQPDADDRATLPVSAKEAPAWMTSVKPDEIIWVDCLPIDEEFGDPMPPINIAVNQSKPGDVSELSINGSHSHCSTFGTYVDSNSGRNIKPMTPGTSLYINQNCKNLRFV